MYPEAISNPLWKLIQDLNPIADMTSLYLGGGTALALQIGHRKSDDLDFFRAEEFSISSFKKSVQLAGLEALFINQAPEHTELMIRSVKVDLMKERIPLQFPLQPC